HPQALAQISGHPVLLRGRRRRGGAAAVPGGGGRVDASPFRGGPRIAERARLSEAGPPSGGADERAVSGGIAWYCKKALPRSRKGARQGFWFGFRIKQTFERFGRRFTGGTRQPRWWRGFDVSLLSSDSCTAPLPRRRRGTAAPESPGPPPPRPAGPWPAARCRC